MQQQGRSESAPVSSLQVTAASPTETFDPVAESPMPRLRDPYANFPEADTP